MPAKTISATLRRACSARRYWLKSMSRFLEKRFSDEDDVVGPDGVAQLGVGLLHLAVRAGAAQLDAPVAAARGDAAAQRDRLHDGEVGREGIRARAGHLA